MSASDVNIIRGYGPLLNPENISQNVDVGELERSMIAAGIYTPNVPDPTDTFIKEMNETATKLGINFDIGATTKSAGTSAVRSDDHSPVRTSYKPDSYDDRPSTLPRANFAPDTRDSHYKTSEEDDAEPPASYSDNFKGYTQEQERRSHINNVFGKAEPQFSIDAEKKEDMKCAMLAEIDSLRSVLEGEDVDLSRVPAVDQSSSYEIIESVLKILRHKNDHASYCTLASELVMFGAYGLEELFDGKTTILGRYQPDLTDWPTTVQTKMRRLRHTTGQVVSDVMQSLNIGAGMRLLIELIPSMITHSYNRKKNAAEGDIFNDATMARSAQNLRGMQR